LGDDAVVLVKSWSDREPGQFWVYRPAGSQWRLIARVRRDVDAKAMAGLTLHRFKARDGLEIPVWVTRPDVGEASAGPRPAVVLVHGGPWVRGGHWQWDEDAQFLASRGYVVIEPEFRGSAGYGRRHFEAGWRQWGLAMQDDLTDALQWAVDQGWVDKSRVCIAGASYGGYAALMGLVRYPDTFRCGIAWVAVTDPRLLYDLAWLSDMSDEVRRYRLPTLVGDRVADSERLAAVAPLMQAAQIRAPLLLAYGGQDRRVPLAHGERLRDALKSAGRDPEWVVYADEGHGWLRPQNRYDFARRVERFLAQHLR
jgi:dipeptidyl aminopeptidase/acylaminoacyl peptidase